MTAKPAACSCACSCGAAAAAQGSPSSTASRRVSGIRPHSFATGQIQIRKYPEPTIERGGLFGNGVAGKFTDPPWPTVVVEVVVDVGTVGGVVAGGRARDTRLTLRIDVAGRHLHARERPVHLLVHQGLAVDGEGNGEADVGGDRGGRTAGHLQLQDGAGEVDRALHVGQ